VARARVTFGRLLKSAFDESMKLEMSQLLTGAEGIPLVKSAGASFDMTGHVFIKRAAFWALKCANLLFVPPSVYVSVNNII
jgi:hypothetical protein